MWPAAVTRPAPITPLSIVAASALSAGQDPLEVLDLGAAGDSVRARHVAHEDLGRVDEVLGLTAQTKGAPDVAGSQEEQQGSHVTLRVSRTEIP